MDNFSVLNGLRVLVVDDNTDTLELIAVILEQYGIAVITAGSAKEAVEAIMQSKPDILISDIAMPGVDGYSLIRTVRSLSSDQGGQLLALALTAYATDEARSLALKSGFQMHLAKPIEPNELVAVVANLAQSHLNLEKG